MKPTLRYLLAIIMLLFIFNLLLSKHEIRSESTVTSFPSAYAADRPRFTKEGELMFLERKTNKRIITIDIEIADNDYERTQGLMHRHSLPHNAGMLFIFERPDPRSFWMRNTYIPLDIIFADGKKQIVNIREKTEPLSYKAILSNKDAQYVVEVNAGFCDKYKIRVGDRIRF
jgi:uncharacterized protein